MPLSSAAPTAHHETKRAIMVEPLSAQHNKPLSNSSSLAAFIEKLRRFFLDQQIESYLVGGGLRDLLRGQQPQDLDLAIQGEAIPIARKLADTLGGSFATLRQEKGVARVTLPNSALASLVIDIATMRNGNIIDDLAKRDFTINALALRLEDIPALSEISAGSSWNPEPALIDPFHGLHDLQQQTLRAVQEHIFHDDPLRLLRAIRIAHRLHFRLAESTSALFQRDAPLLINTAPERIRDELLHIINLPEAGIALQMLDNYYLLPAILPGLYGSDAFTAVIDTTKAKKVGRWKTFTFLSHLLRAFQGEMVSLSADEQSLFSRCSTIREEITFKERWQNAQHNAYPRATLLTLAALVYDAQPSLQETDTSQPEPLLQAIRSDMRRLALGRQATNFIISLLRSVHTPWQIASLPQNGAVRQWRAGRRYFQRFGEQGIDLAVFCLACHQAAQETLPSDSPTQDHSQILINLLDAYYHAHDELIPPALINGQDMITSLEISPGPLVGRLLTEVRNAQIDGAIQTKEEALGFVKDQAVRIGKRNKVT